MNNQSTIKSSGSAHEMCFSEAVRRAIHGLAAERDMSISTLANRIGTPYSSLTTRMSAYRLSLDDVDRIAAALGLTFWDLMNRAKLIASTAKEAE